MIFALRAVAAVDAGASRRQAARRFGVGVSSVIRWVEHCIGETGSVAPKPMGGKRQAAGGAGAGVDPERLAAKPDLTLEELRQELAERGVP